MVLSTHNSVLRTRISSLYGFQPSPVILCFQKGDISTRITSLCGFQPSSVVLCIQKGDFRTRIACLYGFPPSPVVFGLQNRVPSIRLTRLCESQPSSVVFERRTESFGPELKDPMSPRSHLSFCAFKTAWLPLELLVCMGPSPHLWLLQTKQRLLDQNYTSLWVLDLTCRFVHAKQRD